MKKFINPPLVVRLQAAVNVCGSSPVAFVRICLRSSGACICCVQFICVWQDKVIGFGPGEYTSINSGKREHQIKSSEKLQYFCHDFLELQTEQIGGLFITRTFESASTFGFAADVNG